MCDTRVIKPKVFSIKIVSLSSCCTVKAVRNILHCTKPIETDLAVLLLGPSTNEVATLNNQR